MSRIHGWWMVALLLALTRGLGQTSLSVASLATVGKWFSARISLAMGIYSLALGLGFIAAFPGVQKAVEVYGWRPTWSAVGWSLIAIAIGSALLLRSGPGASSEEMRPSSAEVSVVSMSLRDALATPAFWIYGLTCALYSLIAAGTGLFTELMLRERGLPSSVFRAALATTALVGILANFGGGVLGMRRSLPRLLAIATLLLAPCLAVYPLLHSATQAVAWAAGLGATGGIVTVVFFAIWGRMFGPAHLGAIQGAAQALTVIGSAIGPLIFAYVAQASGSYAPAFLWLTPVLIIAAAACWWVRPPAHA